MLSPAIRRAALTALSTALLLRGQGAPAPSAPIKPDDVVATVNGEQITAGMMQRLRRGATQQFQQAAAQNNRDFLKNVAGLLTLARLAENDKIDQIDPYKDQLYFLRLNFLASSYLAYLNTQVSVSQPEIEAHFKDHPEDYRDALVRAIYIAFTRNPEAQAKGRLSEPQARAKAEKLAATLKSGGDFARLAKENSDDSASAQKGGELAPIKRTATGIPVDLRNAIFALQPGQVSPPILQPAGFYLFKLEKFQDAPFEEVASTIATHLQSTKVQAEISRIMGSLKITYDNEAFFAQQPASLPAAPAPAKP